MGGIGQQEMLLLMAFALIFFGAKRLPEIARGIGKGMSEFKKAARDIQVEINREIDLPKSFTPARDSSTPPPPPPPPPSPELTDPGQDGIYPVSTPEQEPAGDVPERTPDRKPAVDVEEDQDRSPGSE
ncbi:twin-arginine translocase TatA/TatE family subunit [Candidatus Zixiibacteriota bacterium]